MIKTIGQVAAETRYRLESAEDGIRVFGVDRVYGLTPEPKYRSSDLSRYKKISPGDFAYNPMRLNIGSIGICTPNHGTGVVSPDYVVFRCDEASLNPLFLNYHLKTRKWLHWVASQGEGSVRERIYFRKLAEYEFDLPSLSYQNRVVAILSSLDDKIEINHRMNETLEAMARAIFKDWFVDFGPTRAKSEGRAPYLAPELWDLFPDALDDEDVPTGWWVGTVGDCFRLTMGQSPPGSTYNEIGKGLPFFQGRTDFKFRYPKNRKYCTEPTRIAECDDTLVSVRAPVGDINMAWEKCCAGRGVAALRHKSGSRSFTYYTAREIQQALKQYEQTGTVFGAINKGQFEALSVVEPTPEIISVFENNLWPLDERIRKNTSENHTLAQTRDLLLPKLMSGEVRLQEVEKAVEAVA